MQFHNGKTYNNSGLRKEDLNGNPFISLDKWINEAKESGIEDYNAFHLSTSDYEGNISGRIVLLKSLHNNKILFFTDYNSRKGFQIDINNKVAATFYWGVLERQIRIEGTVQKTSIVISDEYFAQRPRESQAAAIASNQSQRIENRLTLENRINSIIAQKSELKRPSNWGGYEITPNYIEFWQGRPNRLNDRIEYTKELGKWVKHRLEP